MVESVREYGGHVEMLGNKVFHLFPGSFVGVPAGDDYAVLTEKEGAADVGRLLQDIVTEYGRPWKVHGPGLREFPRHGITTSPYHLKL